MKTIQHAGITYNVHSTMTTEEMARDYPRAAQDFEARGIFGIMSLQRPKGRKAYTGYMDRNLSVFSVDPLF